ncbi:MAG: ABC transporter [Candidatus Cloacimonadota bacterium]|nr:MAG: ABC transporter [Candidatus Cloacimonadota bacterium]
MRAVSLIYKKELKSYFNSPTAYVVLVGFLLICGWFFSQPLFLQNQATLRHLFSSLPMIFIFFIPVITMGVFAKEKSTGTIETLSTLPLSDQEIVAGKFFASLAVIGTGLLFTLVHFAAIILLGSNLDYGAILCGYLGLFLLSGVYSSIGVFSSSLTSNQIVAFIISFFIIFMFFMLEQTAVFMPSSISNLFQYMSLVYHFNNISKGIIDTRDIIYFIALIIFFLRLATVMNESVKWK